MDARFYNSEEIDIERLANDLEQKYRMQGYEVQSIGNKDQMMVQLKKGGDLAALVGMQAALSVIIQRLAGGTVAMIGQQKWIDKAAVGAVGLVAAPVLWPLMLTAGAGAIRQASLGNQVLNEVDWLVRQQKPEVRLGPIPAHLVPQISQQWAQPSSVPVYSPPPPVYTPPTPVYTPPAQQAAPAPAPTQLRCPNCNTPYEEGDTFCTGCGRSLKTLCPNCKTEIKPGVSFCPNCGASSFQTLSASQAAIPQASPAPQPPTQAVPTYTPPKPAPKPATPPPAPKPQPYVPPTPQTPPVMPQPSVTIIPGASKPATPPPPPPAPKVPVYTPPPQSAQPTVQTEVSPNSQTIPAPRQPIKPKPAQQPAVDPNKPWGKLIFSNGQEVQLSGEQALVGRVDHDVPGINPQVDLSKIPGGDTTSRIHATIEHVGSGYTVTDLNSTNSTRVNGRRVDPDKPMPIQDGDTLHFGKVTCTFKKL